MKIFVARCLLVLGVAVLLAFTIAEVFIDLHPQYRYEVLGAFLAIATALVAGTITGVLSISPKSN